MIGNGDRDAVMAAFWKRSVDFDARGCRFALNVELRPLQDQRLGKVCVSDLGTRVSFNLELSEIRID